MKPATTFFILFLCAAASAQPYEGPDTLWTHTLYREVVGDARCRSMIYCSDGCVIISGQQRDAEEHPGEDLFLMKLDGGGNIVWRSVYGDSTAWIQGGGFMCQPREDRFLMAAYGYGYFDDLFTAVADEEGNILRQQFYLWPQNQWVRAICPMRDGCSLIVYKTINMYTGAESAGWMKVTADGDSIWARSISFPGYRVWVSSVDSTRDGGAIIGGYTGPTGIASTDVLLIKIDRDGWVEFSRTYELSEDDYVTDILALPDGGYLLGGSILVWGNAHYTIQPFALRMDSAGDSLWMWTMESPPGGYGMVTEIIAARGGGTTLLCETDIHPSLIRLSPSGEELWNRLYRLPEPVRLGADRCAVQDTLGHYIIVGERQNIESPQDEGVIVITTEPDPVTTDTDSRRSFLPEHIQLTVSPNPFNSSATFTFTLPRTTPVTLTVFNTLGQRVRDINLGQLAAGEHRYVFEADGLPSGVYLARVEAAGRMETRKVVLMR